MIKIRPVTLGPSHSVLALFFLLACSAQATRDDDNRPAPTRGGGTGSGGTVGNGGSTGGTFTPPNPTGGFPSSGSGGGSAGGVVGTGGIVAKGGGGGVVGMTGGTVGVTGGTVGVTGGAMSSGGSGLTVTCDAPWAVGNDGFVKAQGAGSVCWHGYAFTGKSGTATTITPDTYKSCGNGCMICGKGEVEASEAAVAFFGFNAKQVPGMATPGTVTPTGTSLTVSFTKTGTFPLRVQIQAVGGGTDATKRWCYTITGASPAVIPYTMFNTECWEGGKGTAYAMQPLEAVLLLVPGNATAATPYDACITGAKDG